MSKLNADEKADLKFDEQLKEFAFVMNTKCSNEDFIEFSRHARHVLRERERLDAEWPARTF